MKNTVENKVKKIKKDKKLELGHLVKLGGRKEKEIKEEERHSSLGEVLAEKRRERLDIVDLENYK